MKKEPKVQKPESRRKRYELLLSQLLTERATFLPQWREISENYLPRRAVFTVQDVNKGDKRNQKIIDSTPVFAATTLRSGLMSGASSPARPWFRLTTPDPRLAEVAAVKEWLHIVTSRILTVFTKSNLYSALPTFYESVGEFATAAMMVEEDFKSVIRCYPFPIGSYMIANDARLNVNVFAREFRLTVAGLVEKFGMQPNGEIDWTNISTPVRTLWERGERQGWVDVCHIVQPNDEYMPKAIDSKYKKYASVYFEKACGTGDEDKILSEKGYDYFPVVTARWEVTGEDAYGTNCPGMVCLGDSKQLQLGEKRIAQAIEKIINPAMIGPTSLKNARASVLPGDITFDDSEQARGFRPAYQINPRIQDLEAKQEQIRQRINRGHYADLFLMLQNIEDQQRTATEIAERKEEKLIALGPVLEQIKGALESLVDIVFAIELERSRDASGEFLENAPIPKPPKELEGMDLRVDFISVMAQAQKLVGLGGLERYTQFAGQVAGFAPESVDKTDWDQLLDEYGEAAGLPPKVVRTEDVVAEMRQSRAQQQQAQSQAEVAMQSTQAAKNLSQADLDKNSALKQLLDQAHAGQVVPQ